MTTQLGIRARLNLPFEQAIQKTTEALKAEGFGVLTEIDVQATLKQKLDADFRRYVILGACNPPLAHRALSANLDVGLFLPCNVTMYEDSDGAVVTAVDPVAMLGVMKDDQIVCDVAEEARTRLRRVIESLTSWGAAATGRTVDYQAPRRSHMNATNRTTLVAAFGIAVILFLLFSGGMMTGATMAGSTLGGTSWMWVSTLLTLGIGILLGWVIFGKK